MDETILKQLQSIEKYLQSIKKEVTWPWWRIFFQGLLRGAGLVVGTVLTIALAGWILNIFGFIPGIGDMAKNLQAILEARSNY